MVHVRRKAELELLSDIKLKMPSEGSAQSNSPLCRYVAEKIWKKVKRSECSYLVVRDLA
jgi:hypothetical protein